MTRRTPEAEDSPIRRRSSTDTRHVVADEAGPLDPARPPLPDHLLTDPRLDNRGHEAVRAALVQQLQQRQGNRILQRLVGGPPAPAGTAAAAPEAPTGAPSLSDPPAYLAQR